MKRIDKSHILAFVIGAIVFGSTGVIAATMLANNISYDNTTSGLSANNVQGAIDELYTKANTSYDEYNGVTTFTPSTSTQTVLSNNKIMKSDITINPIPSSYKNLSTTTTAQAGDIMSGKTAYNSLGELLTGTLSTECLRTTITFSSSVTASNPLNGQVILNFIPKYYMWPNSHGLQYGKVVNNSTTMYDINVNTNSVVSFGNGGMYFANNKTYVYAQPSEEVGGTWELVACK